MKKLILIGTALFFIISMAGCSSKTIEEGDSQELETESISGQLLGIEDDTFDGEIDDEKVSSEGKDVISENETAEKTTERTTEEITEDTEENNKTEDYDSVGDSFWDGEAIVLPDDEW